MPRLCSKRSLKMLGSRLVVMPVWRRVGLQQWILLVKRGFLSNRSLLKIFYEAAKWVVSA